MDSEFRRTVLTRHSLNFEINGIHHSLEKAAKDVLLCFLKENGEQMAIIT